MGNLRVDWEDYCIILDIVCIARLAFGLYYNYGCLLQIDSSEVD